MKSKFYIYFLLVFSVLFSCKDVLEEDISNKEIKLYSPSNNFKSGSFKQTFWWEEIEGVRKYQLEIVSLSEVKRNNGIAYDTIALLFDTMATKNKITLPLKPGFFQWRVRGHNAGYKSNYSETRMFEIDSATIDGQDIVMIRPESTDKIYRKKGQSSYLLEWFHLEGAKQYLIEVETGGTVTSETVPATQTKYTVNFKVQNEEYKVTVQGKSNQLFSNKSSAYTFEYDAINPPIAELDSVDTKSPVIVTWGLKDDVNSSDIVKFRFSYTVGTSTAEKIKDINVVDGQLKYSSDEIIGNANEKVTYTVTSYDRAGNFAKTPAKTFTISQ